MDSMQVSGAWDAGSIPAGATKNQLTFVGRMTNKGFF